jgi:hypothetical protein
MQRTDSNSTTSRNAELGPATATIVWIVSCIGAMLAVTVGFVRFF